MNARIAILFEYSSLSGGEFSMLAAMQRLRSRFEWSGWLPSAGPLADALREQNFPVVDFSLHTSEGKLSAGELPTQLRRLIEAERPQLLHANSLSMSRSLGQVAHDLSVPTTGHLRDIMKLSSKAIDDLNSHRALAAVSKPPLTFTVDKAYQSRSCT